jgi:uncharacterized membrane protein HdeD (DUF308 family)
MESLKEKTAKGLFWGGMNNGIQQLLGLIFGIILARLLDPSDYGLIAMITIYSLIATALQNSGFSTALVNEKEPKDSDYNAVFWFNILMGVVIYVILFFSAPLIAAFNNEPRLVSLCRYAFIGILFSCSGAAQAAYLFKNLRAKQLAKASIIATILSSGVAAVMDLARISTLKKPYYTMVFMLFSGEESGLKGSKYAAEHPLIDYRKVKLLCNIDMFCGGDEGLMFFNAKSDNTKGFYNQLKQLNDQEHVALEIRARDNRPNSDHWWFTDMCPSIFLLTMGGPYGGYHDPADTCQGCGLAHYNDFLSLIKRLALLD